jgi:hypothetical protein
VAIAADIVAAGERDNSLKANWAALQGRLFLLSLPPPSGNCNDGCFR